MTTSAVSFQVVGTPRRRPAPMSPSARPDLGAPLAHPSRNVSPGRLGKRASCRVVSPERRSPWLAMKVAVMAALTVVGGAVATVQLVGEAMSPDPALGYVAGDPAWAHVTQP